MKHSPRVLLLGSENLTRLFLRSYKIDIDEYTNDINFFEDNVSEWSQVFAQRYIHDIDVYPYLYILFKVYSKSPNDVRHFLRYFLVILQKHGVYDGVIPEELSVKNVLELCSDHDLFIYFAATLQYYFL